MHLPPLLRGLGCVRTINVGRIISQGVLKINLCYLPLSFIGVGPPKPVVISKRYERSIYKEVLVTFGEGRANEGPNDTMRGVRVTEVYTPQVGFCSTVIQATNPTKLTEACFMTECGVFPLDITREYDDRTTPEYGGKRKDWLCPGKIWVQRNGWLYVCRYVFRTSG